MNGHKRKIKNADAAANNRALNSHEPSTSTKNIKQTTQLQDLNTDCIVEMLGYLRRIEDIINFAQTCRFFKECSELAVVRFHRSIVYHFVVNASDICNDRRYKKRFFVQFGHLVKNLEIDGLSQISLNYRILSILTRLSHDNLRTLQLRYVVINFLKMSKAGQKKLVKLFSNLNQLTLIHCKLYGWKSIMKPINSKLESLHLDFAAGYIDIMKYFICKLPCLNTLTLKGSIPHQMLKLNRHIQELNITFNYLTIDRVAALSELNNLTRLTLALRSVPTMDLRNVPTVDLLQLSNINGLEYVNLKIRNAISTANCAKLLKWFQNNNELSELHFYVSIVNYNANDYVQLDENAFPNLEIFSFNVHEFMSLQIVPQMKSLFEVFLHTEHCVSSFGFHRLVSQMITVLPKLRRLNVFLGYLWYYIDETYFDTFTMQEICKCRKSDSKLLIFVGSEGHPMRATIMDSNTIFMYPACRSTLWKFNITLTSAERIRLQDFNGSAFEAAEHIAKKGTAVIVNFDDFSTRDFYQQQ